MILLARHFLIKRLGRQTLKLSNVAISLILIIMHCRQVSVQAGGRFYHLEKIRGAKGTCRQY